MARHSWTERNLLSNNQVEHWLMWKVDGDDEYERLYEKICDEKHETCIENVVPGGKKRKSGPKNNDVCFNCQRAGHW
jgi:hypothetical protein